MSAVTDFLATQGIFTTTDEDGAPVYYRNSDDGRQILRGEALDNMFSSFGLEAQGQQARDANGNLLLALDDPQKLAQAQQLGAVEYVNGIPYANYMANRGPQGSSALFPDMPQSGLGEFLGNLALVAGPAIAGGLGAFGAADAGTVAGGGVGGGTAGAIEGGLASSPLTGVGVGSYGGANSALGALGAGAGATGAIANGLDPITTGEAISGSFTPATAAEMAAMGVPTSAAAAGGAGGAALTPLARLLGLGQTGSDIASVLGPLAGAGLGYLGSQQQQNAFQDVANQQLAIGAPYRNQLQQSYQPGFDLASQPGYGDAFGRIADISSRAYSAKMGNPAENPTAQAGILSDVWNQGYLPALTNYRGGLMQAGGMGLNTSGTASLAGANQAGGSLNALGYGVGSVTQPQNDISALLRQLGSGGQNYSLNVGGLKYS